MATWYINADTGNDTTGSGTSVAPWLLLSKAITSSTSGDSIVCQTSTATFSFEASLALGGKSLNISAAVQGGAIFDGASADRQWNITTGSGLTVSLVDLVFQNISRTSNSPIININGALVLTLNITRCVFKPSVKISTGTNNAVIGIQNGAGSTTPTINITACLFNNVTSTASPADSYISIWGGQPVTLSLLNNTFYMETSATRPNYIIRYQGAYTSTTSIKNCIIKNATGGTITWQVVGSTTVNNTTSNNCTNSITSFPAGTANITTDPLFVDVINADFHLRSTSPCIDTGVIT